jgi:hypothetical protein
MNTRQRSRVTPKSARLSRHIEHSGSPASDAPAPGAPRFYDSESSLARIVAEFLAEGFNDGNPGIVITTEDQRAEIVRELTARSYDVEALQRSRDFLLLDAQQVLSTIIVDGKPDARRFQDEVRQVIECVRRARPDCTVRMFGQMIDVLWRQGDRSAAIRLELLWNQLAQTQPSLVCGYAIGNFYKDARLEDVCGGASTACDSSRRGPKRNGHR